MTEADKIEPEDPWAAATHAGNEREQLRRWAKMTLTEKVRWLERAHRLSIKLAAGRDASKHSGTEISNDQKQ